MTGNVKLRQAWRIAQSILVVSALPRRCRGCAQVRSSPRAVRNRILEWPERRGEIVESSFAPPTSKGTSRMTIATRVLEMILPIEPVPVGTDSCSQARFEKMKCLREAQRSTSDSRHSCAASFRRGAHCRGVPSLRQGASRRVTMHNARTRLN